MNLPPVLRQRYFNQNGTPLAGGKLYTYQAGTTTPQVTYTDQTGATPNANPITLDANGECSMWLDPSLSYKFVLQDSNGVVQWTVDSVVGILIPNAVSTAALQDQAVTTQKVADGAITAAKLATGAITRTAMNQGTIAKSNVATKTAAYTLTDNDDIILVDCTLGAITITLPAASGEQGRIFTITKKDTTQNIVTIARTGTDLISGETSQSIVNPNNSLDIYSDGSNWYVK